MAIKSKLDFVFKKHMNIGEADAENDKTFLEKCFVDVGDFEVLCNTEAPQCIVLGRTGVGKSALLEHIEANVENPIRIEPEELAIRHISNSTIIRFFEDLGVNLDIFYNLLWQHTFAVELIKNKYGIDCQGKKSTFFDSISAIITGNAKKQQALSYIEEWGEKFWLDTEPRIKEFTQKLEESLQAAVEGKVPGLNLKTSLASSLTEEQKSEVIYYGKKVVSAVQLQKLSKIINLLSEDIFTDEKNKTYIIIDRLDENWVEDSLRYKLIRALIETVKKFRSIKPVKIIFSLRTDLLNRVLDKTRDSGFQREKYNSLFLNVRWNRAQIKDILDARISELLRNKYTKSEVSFSDVFPAKMDKISGEEYIIERTFLRPRDAITFVNFCLTESEGKSEITSSIVKLAEKGYSQDRVESLKHEWFVEHPTLQKYLDILVQKTDRFKVSVLTSDILESLILELVEHQDADADIAIKSAHDFFGSSYPLSDELFTKFRQNLLFILYKIGVVGIKVDGPSTTRWIQDRTQDLTSSKIQPTSIVYIHKILWRSLAIDMRKS